MKRAVFSLSIGILMHFFVACDKEESGMTMTLHDKPLSVIEETIKGRWKWHATLGGFVAVTYHTNRYMTFNDSCYFETIDGKDSASQKFIWVKKRMEPFGYETYGMWIGSDHEIPTTEKNIGIRYFDRIKNDTLYFCIENIGWADMPSCEVLVKIK